MRRIRWTAIFLAAALMLGLFAACKNGTEPSPTPTLTPPPETTAPPTTPPPETTAPPLETTAPPPTVTWEPLVFPDLDGFEKIVDDENSQVVYDKEGSVYIGLSYFPATEEQLSETAEGYGPELETLLGQVFMGSVVSSKSVDLPGLSRKGLEVEIDFAEGFAALGMVIPSESQIIVMFGLGNLELNENAKQDLLDAYDQLVKKLVA